jgi:predicted phosphoribosyltransferase
VPDRPDEPPKRPDFAARRKKYWKWHTLSNEEVKAMREAEYEGTLEDLHGL